jgi:predicted DNA-binding transcriptional regulator AlpA
MTMQHQDTDKAPLIPLPENDDTLIRRSELPKYIPIAPQTWARWATESQGPPFIKLGRRLVAYRAGDLREWLYSQSRQNTIDL